MWQGMKLYQLTLEERATCPDHCEQWDNCYGNNMPFGHRFDHNDEKFLPMLALNIAELARRNKQGFVVRLHVLGDFYSEEYVTFWRDQLKLHEGLNIYGYTHHRATSPIGRSVKVTNLAHPSRFRVRFSDDVDEPFSTHVVRSADEISDGDVICPEQLDKTDSCTTCGLCWTQPKRRIMFLEH